MGINGTGFFQAGCPSCYPANIVEVLNETQHKALSEPLIWPHPVFFHLMERVLFSLCCLCSVSTSTAVNVIVVCV